MMTPSDFLKLKRLFKKVLLSLLSSLIEVHVCRDPIKLSRYWIMTLMAEETAVVARFKWRRSFFAKATAVSVSQQVPNLFHSKAQWLAVIDGSPSNVMWPAPTSDLMNGLFREQLTA